MAKISVVMPVYNAENYVAASIDSILAQTFTDFELIIVNDGSNDATDNIIKKYKDDRIKYFSHNQNRGSVPCLREAIDIASSDFIATQDADDISIIDRLTKQYAYLSTHDDIFCLGGFAYKIDENGEYIGSWSFPPADHDSIVNMLVRNKKCPIINPTSMFRKAGYLQIGGYSLDKNVVASYDLELWCKSILFGLKFANLEEFLLRYRWHSNSMTQRLKWPQVAAYNKIMSEFIRKYKK